MAMASLNASLLARKGSARPVHLTPQASVSSLYTKDVEVTHSHEKTPTWPQNTHKSAHKNAKLDKRQSCKKSVRLSKVTDKDLRLLAASLGTSQQRLMEQAITVFLKKAYRDRGCICRAQ